MPFEPEHEDEEPQAKVPPITLAHESEKRGSVPPPPNAFSEAEALRWPAIREALTDETRSRVGQGLAVRVVRGYAAASDTPPKVAAVLEKTVTWRREYDVDAALTKPAPAWEAYQRLWPCMIHGPDDHGRLVVCERFGSMDVAQLLEEVSSCVKIKILRTVRAESSCRPPRHRRDACSMAWRCRFLAARPSQVGRVIARK